MVGYKDDGTRRYKSFYGKSPKEAKDKADAYKQEVAAGLYIDPNLTFQACAEKWYEGYKDKDSVSPTTYESYGYTLKTLVKGFGPRKLASIKALDVEDFLKGLRADGKSDSYLAKCRSMLHQIMHKAEANDLIRKNPVRFAEKIKAQRPVQRTEAFTGGSAKAHGGLAPGQDGVHDPAHAGNGNAYPMSPNSRLWVWTWKRFRAW